MALHNGHIIYSTNYLQLSTMWLENIKVRVKKYPQGFVVEVQKTRFRLLGLFPIRYWVHIESVSGMADKPRYYYTLDRAVDEASKHFKWDLLIGYAEYN